MVVTLHLVEEDFGLRGGGVLYEVGINDIEDIIAEFVQFAFNLVLVGSDLDEVFLRLRLGLCLFY
jgi:hypothetical protein